MNIGTVMVLGIMDGIMIAAWAMTRKKMKKEKMKAKENVVR